MQTMLTLAQPVASCIACVCWQSRTLVSIGLLHWWLSAYQCCALTSGSDGVLGLMQVTLTSLRHLCQEQRHELLHFHVITEIYCQARSARASSAKHPFQHHERCKGRDKKQCTCGQWRPKLSPRQHQEDAGKQPLMPCSACSADPPASWAPARPCAPSRGTGVAGSTGDRYAAASSVLHEVLSWAIKERGLCTGKGLEATHSQPAAVYVPQSAEQTNPFCCR